MRPLSAVFLDAGGTLIHLDRVFILDSLAQRGLKRTEQHFVQADAAARREVEQLVRSGGPSDDASRWHAYGLHLLQRLGCRGEDVRAVQEALIRRHAEGWLYSYTVEGTLDALRQVRDMGCTLGIVSNADGRIETFLERAGLGGAFDFIVDSGIVGVEKPDPRIFHIACQRAGVQPQDAVHVGDFYEIDVMGARAAGVRPLLLDPDDLHPHADCERVRAITELPDWLNQLQYT
jgi:putative hydrolase of the HAD superfamily